MVAEFFHKEYNSVMISTVLEKVSRSRNSLIYAIRKSNIPVWIRVINYFKMFCMDTNVHLNNINLI